MFVKRKHQYTMQEKAHPNGFTPKTWLETKLISHWLHVLESKAELQAPKYLGKVAGNTCAMCCLGALGFIAGKLHTDSCGGLSDMDRCDIGLMTDYEELGLNRADGRVVGKVFDVSQNLDYQNDSGTPWPKIAAFIRANPEAVFNAEHLATVTEEPPFSQENFDMLMQMTPLNSES